MKFKVGDKVKIIKVYVCGQFMPQYSGIGTVTEVHENKNLEFPAKEPAYYYTNIEKHEGFPFLERELDFFEETEEMKLRKEELRLKYITIDPYGEEDWVE